jgi:AcrR family transcriptional regulator
MRRWCHRWEHLRAVGSIDHGQDSGPDGAEAQVTEDDAPRVAKLRQARAHRTRQTLRDAASRLWTARGYDAVAVSEICEQAGVSKGRFFYYFPTKEHLLLEVVAGGAAEAMAVTVDQRLGEGATVLEVFATVVAQLADAQRYAPRELLGRAAVEVLRGARRARPDDAPELREVYARIFATGIERGELPATFHPQELGAITNGVMLQGVLFWALDVVGTLSLHEVLWRRARLVVHGATLSDLEATDPLAG